MATMAMAMTVAAAGALSAGATIYAGRQQAQQANMQVSVLKNQQIATQNEALAAENERRRRLMLNLSANVASGAHSGFSAMAPGTSFAAIRAGNVELAEKDIAAIRSGAELRNLSTSIEIEGQRLGRRAALTSAALKAGSTLLGSGVDAYKLT